MTGKTYVDGTDIYSKYGVYITSGGWSGLVAMPPLKTPDSNDWQEEDGIEVDLSSPVLDTREATVTFACAPDASRITDFIAMLSDGAYHEFDCRWIGRTYTLRLVSQSKLSYNPALGTFSLKLADDFPLSGYSYKSPSRSMPAHDDYLIDGTPLTDYGVRVLSGTLSNVLSTPNVKTNLLRNISVVAGADYDAKAVTFKSKDVKVQCLMRAATLDELWRNWDALLYDLVRPDERLLYCGGAGRQYACHYKSCSVSAFNPEGRIWLQFALTLTFTYDTRMDYVIFRINPTPSDANVTINGKAVTFVQVAPGTSVSWSVSKEGYVSKSGSQTVNSSTTVSVTLSKESYVVTFKVSPTDAKVTVNGTTYTPNSSGVVTITAEWGDVLEWSVSRDGYGTASGSHTVTKAETIEVELIDAADVISSLSYEDIPAGGGTVMPSIGAIEGATLTYSGTGVNAATGAVSADSLGTEVTERAKVTTVTVTASYGGTSISASCDVYQQANVVERTDTMSETYGAVTVTAFTYEDISAGGNTVAPSLTYSQAVTGTYMDTYTSGATKTRDGSSTLTSGATITYSGTGVNTSTGAVTRSSLGTILKDRTLVTTSTVTVTMNGKEGTATAPVYQEANEIIKETGEDTYGDITITGGHTYGDISAGGGTVTPTAPTYEQLHTWGHTVVYTSGATESDGGGSETLTDGATLIYSGTGVNTSTGAVSADSLGKTEKSRTLITKSIVAVVMNGKEASVDADVYQQANTATTSTSTTYSTPTVTLSYKVDGVTGDDIPAGGGTAEPVLSYSQTKTTTTTTKYTSGESTTSTSTTTLTSGATITYSGTGVASDGTVTASSLGTTVKSRSSVATATVTVTMNGQSNTASCTVYQQANAVDTTVTTVEQDDFTIDSFEYKEDIPADGGTVYPTIVFWHQHLVLTTTTYTSGATTTDTDFDSKAVTPDSVVYSKDGLILREPLIDPSTGAATASAATSTEREDLATVTCVAAYTSPETGETLTASATADVWQAAREVWLTVTPIALTIAEEGGSATVEVSSSSDWEATADSSWLTVTPSSGGGGD